MTPKPLAECSARLRWTSRICRLLPICLAHRVGNRLFPLKSVRAETGRIVTRSSLARVLYDFPGPAWPAITVAVNGYLEWRNVVVANTVCSPGDTIVDVGAHMGTETLLFARRVGPGGRVHSFEPAPEVFGILSAMVRLNDVGQIKLHQAAVSDQKGTIQFLAPGGPVGLAEGRLAEAGSSTTERVITVQSVVLDELYAAGEFGSPRLLVIDVEGADLFVLRGAKKIIETHHPCILIEVHPFILEKHGLAKEDVYAFLRDRGYEIFRMSSRGLQPLEGWDARTIHCVCIPEGRSPAGQKLARRIQRRLRGAALLPPIKHLNPAVITTPTGR